MNEGSSNTDFVPGQVWVHKNRMAGFVPTTVILHTVRSAPLGPGDIVSGLKVSMAGTTEVQFDTRWAADSEALESSYALAFDPRWPAIPTPNTLAVTVDEQPQSTGYTDAERLDALEKCPHIELLSYFDGQKVKFYHRQDTMKNKRSLVRDTLDTLVTLQRAFPQTDKP